jgi:sulfur carrier protein ThiS
MEECDYCGESFEGEKAYVKHLRTEHVDELGPIDRRRVGADDEGGSDLPVGPLALALVIGATVAIVAYVTFFAGGGGTASGSVGPAGSAHYHGSMEVVVLGERVDFSRSEYQLRDDRFHFEAGDGTQWHAHATGVTLDYAMESLGFDVTRTSFTYQGTTYRDSSEEYTVRVTVNGDRVTPEEYVLQEGDRVRVVVEEA